MAETAAVPPYPARQTAGRGASAVPDQSEIICARCFQASDAKGGLAIV